MLKRTSAALAAILAYCALQPATASRQESLSNAQIVTGFPSCSGPGAVGLIFGVISSNTLGCTTAPNTGAQSPSSTFTVSTATAVVDFAVPASVFTCRLIGTGIVNDTSGATTSARLSFDNAATYGAGAGDYTGILETLTSGYPGNYSIASSYPGGVPILLDSATSAGSGAAAIEMTLLPGTASIATQLFGRSSVVGSKDQGVTVMGRSGATNGRPTNLRLVTSSGKFTAGTFVLSCTG